MSSLTRFLASQSATEKLGFEVVEESCRGSVLERRNATLGHRKPTRQSVLQNRTGRCQSPAGLRSESKWRNQRPMHAVQPCATPPSTANWRAVGAQLGVAIRMLLALLASYRSLRQES